MEELSAPRYRRTRAIKLIGQRRIDGRTQAGHRWVTGGWAVGLGGAAAVIDLGGSCALCVG
jgi:hypothetical protein